MTLTIGTGPFGDQSTGTFNFEVTAPATILYTWKTSRAVKFLREKNPLPVCYFSEDVR